MIEDVNSTAPFPLVRDYRSYRINHFWWDLIPYNPRPWLYILSEQFPSFPFVDNFRKWLKIGQPNFSPVENNGKIIPNQLLMGGSSVDRHRQSCFRKNGWYLEWFHDWWFPISIVGYAWISHVLRFKERSMAAEMIRWCYTNIMNLCIYSKYVYLQFTYIYIHIYTYIYCTCI